MIPIPPLITDDYQLVPTDSVSSLVFACGRNIFKLTQRNSLARAAADYKILRDRLDLFGDRVLPSWFGETVYAGATRTVVAQRHFAGQTLASFCRQPGMFDWVFGNERTGRENARFVLALVEWLLEATDKGELYPDPVGRPAEPLLHDSVNLLVGEFGRVVLCDVGLSPHEDTLATHGAAFYGGENVRTYRRLMELARTSLAKRAA